LLFSRRELGEGFRTFGWFPIDEWNQQKMSTGSGLYDKVVRARIRLDLCCPLSRADGIPVLEQRLFFIKGFLAEGLRQFRT